MFAKAPDSARQKECINCGKLIEAKPSRWGRLKGFPCCSRACRGEYLKQAFTGHNNPNSKRQSVYDDWWRKKVIALRHSATQRKLSFNITEEYLKAIYEKQNGLCFYSGIPLQLGKTDDWNNKGQADPDVLSVDRLDWKLGYEEGNIVLCCVAINKFKGRSDFSTIEGIFQYIAAKYMQQCSLKIKILPGGKPPIKAKMGDVGFDVFVQHVEELPNNLIKVYTGICIQPSMGWYGELVPRSSIIKTGLICPNSFGVIDNGYRGELIGYLLKIRDDAVLPKEGDRVFQLVFRRYYVAQFEEVDELDESSRENGAFGSSGT